MKQIRAEKSSQNDLFPSEPTNKNGRRKAENKIVCCTCAYAKSRLALACGFLGSMAENVVKWNQEKRNILA
jgi:hypothetical protein